MVKSAQFHQFRLYLPRKEIKMGMELDEMVLSVISLYLGNEKIDLGRKKDLKSKEAASVYIL